MADVKINNGKYVLGDDGFEATTGDSSAPEESNALDHDTDNAINTIGKGAKVTEHLDPLIMADDGYFDLPAESTGHATLLIGDAEYLFEFDWDRYNNVNLIAGSSSSDLVTGADNDTQFCAFDNTSSVRVKNRLGSAKRVLGEIHYTELPVVPTFQIFAEPSGVDNLDPYLTIDGTTVTPMFRYKGGDANSTDWEAWGYGETLTRVAVATPPTYNDGSPGLGVNNDSCLFNASDYYQAGNNTFADITTEDFVFEVVWKSHPSGVNKRIAAKRIANTDEGWEIQDRTDNKLLFTIEDSSANNVSLYTAAVTPGTWNYAIAFFNRDENSDNGAVVYLNGVVSDDANPSVASASISSAIATVIGASSTGGFEYDSNIAYLALWKQEDWHQAGVSGPAEWAVIAKERFLKFSGMYPQIANGTYLPNTATRAYPAYLDKVEDGYRKLYYVGGEWLRMCHRQDSAGTNVRGYLPETEAENLFPESENFNAGWLKYNAGDTLTDNAEVCPDGRTVAASMIADSTSSAHFIYSSITTTAATTYSLSVFAKPGNKNWIRFRATSLGDCYFDIANGVVGTADSCTGYVEGPFYNEFYRCCIVFTGDGSSHGMRIYSANTDGDVGISDGDGLTVNTYIWGAQLELGDYMTSPIITSGSSLTRLSDQLQFVAGDNIGGENVGEGTVVCDVLLPDFDMQDSARFVDISDGGSTSDHVYLYTSSASDKLYGSTRASAGDDGNTDGTTDMADGVMHEARMLWETDNLRILLDGSLEGTADTACDMPDALDEMDIGSNLDGGAQFKGLIQNLRIYDEVTLLG